MDRTGRGAVSQREAAGGQIMEKQLYELMDWPEIEAVVYSESQRPKELLGAHRTGTRDSGSGLFPGGRNRGDCDE